MSIFSHAIIHFFALAATLYSQSARLRPAEPIQLLGVSDSNSPMHWNAQGQLVIFQSDGMPIRSQGESLTKQGVVRAVRFYSYEHAPLWLEATWRASNGDLYAWYHHEQWLNCDVLPLSQPVIGALKSTDDGLTFHDLGLVLTPAEEPDCNASNGYFGGGHGDFSVIADPSGDYLYFLFSNYSGPRSAQGVALARMAISDLDNPQGAVFKYDAGAFESPGLGGPVTPIFSASVSWQEEDTDSLWGPSIHYNNHLKRYVVVMNHACCSPGWPQAGLYISFATNLAQPETFTPPQKLLDGGGWYPMIVGQTDKQSNRTARLFLGSHSDHEIEFLP
jgi:hypothetical protein